MKYFIDTNIFLRVLELENKQQFQECSHVLAAIKNSKISAFISPTVLAEIAWVLGSYYKEPKSIVLKSLESIKNLGNLKIIDDSDIGISLKLFKKYNVKYIDTLIASQTKIQNKQMTVISYDKDFEKLPVKHLTPKELLAKL